MRPVLVAIGAVLLMGAGAPPVEVSGSDCIITDPPASGVWVWVDGSERVSEDIALAAFYPGRALRQKAQGEATLRCIGDSCAVIDETEIDFDFGPAAEKVARAKGLLPTAKPMTIKVAFRITGPGRGRQWECGQTPPP